MTVYRWHCDACNANGVTRELEGVERLHATGCKGAMAVWPAGGARRSTPRLAGPLFANA